MKHTILVLFFAALALSISLDANAQGLVYTPFIPQQSSSSYGGSGYGSGYSSRPTSQTQVIRTTAYYVDNYYGNYYKVPIKVEYTVYSNGATTLYVTEQWESQAFGGQWRSVPGSARVMSCQPMTAYGNTGRLEQTFMYKAFVGTNWYYFDL